MKKITMWTAVLTALALAMPQSVLAAPEFAKQWNSSCASCHVGAPTALDEEGVAFKLAGYEMGIEPDNPRPALFFSFITDLATYDSANNDEEMVGPEAATLFSLLRLDRAGRAKIFAIGELTDDDVEGVDLEFAHGHVQFNPLEKREKLNIRVGNVEPMTRMWNSDMRRVFETPLWGGFDAATGELTSAGGHHAHGGSSGRLGVLPASEWGGDVTSVIGSDLMVTAGATNDVAYGGVFWKRGGRGFDNSTTSRSFDGGELSAEEQAAFSQQQTRLAKKWERSVIFGLSAHVGKSSRQVFDGTFLAPDDHGMEDEHGDEGDDHGDEGDDHGDEGDDHGDEGDDHGDEGDDHGDDEHGAFLPARLRDASRLVGEIVTRWDRFGLYAVGVYGDNDYSLGDAEHWEEHGEFELTGGRSTDFFAWAVEASARFGVDRRRTGRASLRYEELRPEATSAPRFQRAVANVTIPIRIMRPALWPYAEVSRNLVTDDWRTVVGVRLGY